MYAYFGTPDCLAICDLRNLARIRSPKIPAIYRVFLPLFTASLNGALDDSSPSHLTKLEEGCHTHTMRYVYDRGRRSTCSDQTAKHAAGRGAETISFCCRLFPRESSGWEEVSRGVFARIHLAAVCRAVGRFGAGKSR